MNNDLSRNWSVDLKKVTVQIYNNEPQANLYKLMSEEKVLGFIFIESFEFCIIDLKKQYSVENYNEIKVKKIIKER